MRKFIGTVVVILVLYLGFFGSKRFDIDPFILEWLQSDKPSELKEKAEDITEDIVKKGKEVGKDIEKAVSDIE